MKITELLQDRSDLICGSGVGKSAISAAESTLGLRFADEYREYLLAFSCAIVDSRELTGICNVARTSVVPVTIAEWQANPNVEHTLYVIEQANIDGIVIWQDGSGIVFQSQPNMPPEKIADSLVEYLQM